MNIKPLLSILFVCLIGCSAESETDATSVLEPIKDSPTLFFNGVIHTVDSDQPLADAFVFDADGLIHAVGSAEELRGQYPSAKARDLDGATVIPGLIDAHAHLHNLALSYTRARLSGTRDVEDVISRLKEHEQGLGEQDWLLGRGWDQNDWPVKEFPGKEDLDAHFPDRPVILTRIDGHASWVNSAALALVDRDLSGNWQPQGGFIHRDSGGQPSGVLIDTAQSMVRSLVPSLSEEAYDKALDLALQEVTGLGLTGIHDPGLTRTQIERFINRIEQGRFPLRVHAMTDGADATLSWACESGGIDHPSGFFSVRASKLYADGALGSRGAALLEPYSDEPGNSGLLFLEGEELSRQVGRVLECGFQVAVHAIGDRANRQALDIIEAQMANHPDNPGRHRVEHAQVLSGPDMSRFASLGIIAAMQPTHATSDMYWAEQRLGPTRTKFAYAWRDLLDSGAVLALGSDFPVEEVNPMHGLYAAISRMDLHGSPEGGWRARQAMTRAEALRGFTLDAAFAAFSENELGSLEAGKRADFLLLDQDIMSIEVHKIPQTRVLETWLDGNQVFSRE